MKIKILIGAIVVVTIGAIGYFSLGGAEEVVITHEEVNDYVMIGMDYNGRYRSEELRDIYEEIKNKLDSGIIEGVMVVVNYNMDNDSLESGFIHQFLGIQLNMVDNYKVPEGFTFEVIKASSAIKATIGAHNLVMPSPEEIDEQIAGYAQTNKLKTVDFSIEKYISDRELVVEVPAVE